MYKTKYKSRYLEKKITSRDLGFKYCSEYEQFLGLGCTMFIYRHDIEPIKFWRMEILQKGLSNWFKNKSKELFTIKISSFIG